MDIRSFLTKPPKNSQLSRRAMLRAAGCGFGYMGLQSLMAEVAQAQASVVATSTRWLQRRRCFRPAPSA